MDKTIIPSWRDLNELDEQLCEFGWLSFRLSADGRQLLDHFAKGAEDFFKQPLASKLAFKVSGGAVNYRGYFEPKSQNYDLEGKVKDLKEGFDFGLHLMEKNDFHHFYGPNLVPPELSLADRFLTTSLLRAESLTQALALSLGQHSNFFLKYFRPPICNLRMLSYRATESPSQNSQHLVAHKDPGFITLVHPTGPGLEYLANSGEWLECPWEPGMAYLMTGVTLERWTDGRWRAPRHRVAKVRESRISACMFFNPSYEAEITSLAGTDSFQAGRFIYAESVEGPEQHEGLHQDQVSNRLR